MLRFSADEGFWDAACERYWHREPFAFAVDADAAPFDEAGVFAALIAPGDRDPLDWLQVAEGSNPAQLRDYRLGTFKRFGPQSADGDFAGYYDRMAGVSFGFNVHDLGRRNPRWRTSRTSSTPNSGSIRFHRPRASGARHLRRHLPGDPFGIHRDNASVFSFCLVGGAASCSGTRTTSTPATRT